MQGRPSFEIDTLRRRIPEDRSELYLGFTPWQTDFAGWIRTVHEKLQEAPGKPIVRTVWDNPDQHGARVLVEVATRASADDALEALVERLSWNQLAALPEGPPDLGYASFAHPEDLPPTVYFFRGNVCITVAGFGREAVPIIPLARRLDQRLTEHPNVERTTITMEPDQSSAKIGRPISIRYKLPWRIGENGFLKFFCVHGTLRLEDDRPVFCGTRPGRAVVEVFALEPDRETYRGSLEVTIE